MNRPGTRTTTKVMDSQGRDSVPRVPGFADVVTTYDAMDGVLTQRALATPNVVTTYEYDAAGRLVRRSTNGTLDRHWVYVGAHVLAELDGALHKRVQYLYRRGTDEPPASVEAGSSTQKFHVQDEQGIVVGQMVGGTTPAVAQQLEYDPWGKATVQVSSGNRLWWKGLLQDRRDQPLPIRPW